MSKLPSVAELTDQSEGWGFYYCLRKEARPTRSGGTLITLLLQDATGEIPAALVDRGDVRRDDFEAGEFVKVQGRGHRHQQRLELAVDAIRRVNPTQDRLDGFSEEACIPSAPRPIPEMWAELQARIAAVSNPWIRRLLTDVVEAHAARLQTWPAAVAVHHAYRGGLLEHVLALAALGECYARVYGVDADLLLAGAVLHDIGKLEELAGDAAPTYTRDGNLLGHIVLGVVIVRNAIEQIEGFPPELRSRIEHMVVAHHGSRDLGSPAEPMTEEAFVLSAIDDLDARLHQVRRYVRRSDAGAEFTAYHPRLKRVLFRPGGR